MRYFVTGATGFIGRHLVERLLEREGTIYVLVREGSRARLEELHVALGRRAGTHRAGDRRSDSARARRLRRGPEGADGSRALLPPRRDLRHVGRRGEQPASERRGHAETRSRSRTRSAPAASTTPARSRCRAGTAALFREDMFDEGQELADPYSAHEVRVGEDRPRGGDRAVAGLPAGDRRRQLADRRDGQDRRPLLLLQGDPAGARPAAAVDADRRPRGRADQPRARSTSSPRRWTTSPTRTGSTAARSTSPTRPRSPPAR